MDTAEHMFAKCKQLMISITPATADVLADLLYEIGKDALAKRDYNLASRWLERAHDILEGQDSGMLSPEAGELRLCIMQAIGTSKMLLCGSDLHPHQFRHIQR